MSSSHVEREYCERIAFLESQLDSRYSVIAEQDDEIKRLTERLAHALKPSREGADRCLALLMERDLLGEKIKAMTSAGAHLYCCASKKNKERWNAALALKTNVTMTDRDRQERTSTENAIIRKQRETVARCYDLPTMNTDKTAAKTVPPIETGGPAFPSGEGLRRDNGMTLRDWFAGQALNGLLADHKDHSDECANGETCAQTSARLAYGFADAMIAARKK